jgi:hypothetical protein
MKLKFQFSLFLLMLLMACSEQVATNQTEDTYIWQDHYTKKECYIEMRDGINLFTTIYSPIDSTKKYPVLLKRSPYSCSPYGEDTLPATISHNKKLVESGYIFVIQDVRGRYMSEGTFENTKPPYSLKDSSQTDELTDSWDTFEWFEENLSNYNGNAGMYGNSYLGWTTLVGATCNHPSLKAVISSAPVTNFYFEDFNRNGLFALNYLPVISAFGTPRLMPVDSAWWPNKDAVYGKITEHSLQPDYYGFFLDRLALSNFSDVIDSTDFFWKEIQNHPNYDEFRKERNWAQYYNDIKCQVMVVGGWNDEQNLFGIIESFKHIAKNSPKANAQLVMGPWSHGHPTRGDSAYYLGDVFYGYNLSKDYMENIEFPYFEKHLKGVGQAPDFKVKLFDTGKNEWKMFNEFPTSSENNQVFHLRDNKMISVVPEISTLNDYQTFISDPFHPVPYFEGDEFYDMAPKAYFTADQRFLSKRPDVLSFESDLLKEDMTVLGEIKAVIDFATNLKDADLFVKVIDVYPMNRIPLDTDPEGVKMNGYQQLVRSGQIRGRYREGYEKGVPFVPNKKTQVEVPLIALYHTFKKGHKIMVQIQSSQFPLFDMNPQNYVENIYYADRSDFAVAMHKVFASSMIYLPVVK